MTYIESGNRAIWITSSDEAWATTKVMQDIIDFIASEGAKLYEWTATSAMQEIPLNDLAIIPQPDMTKILPTRMFDFIAEQRKAGNSSVFFMKDLDEVMNHEWRIRRYLEDLFISSAKSEPLSILIVISKNTVPASVKDIFRQIKVGVPSKEYLSTMLDNVIEECSSVEGYETEYSSEEKKDIVNSVTGLNFSKVKNLMTESIVRFNKVNADFLKEERTKAFKQDELITCRETKISFDEVGGNEVIKDWLRDVKILFSDEARKFGLPAPKGYMAVGVPGSAKTMLAEAFANYMGLPLFDLAIHKVMNSQVGESERRIEQALETVRSCSPCILLIDEVEKILGGAGQSSNRVDGGITNRIMASLLRFMQDNEKVFVVMTTNDMSQLPPEFTRKGRLDEHWYFGIPNQEEREDILKVHFKKYPVQVYRSTLDAAVRHTAGYTGAELAEVVANFMKKKFIAEYKGDETKSDKELIVESANEVIPISHSSKERIAALERWCKGRARNAGKQDAEVSEPVKMAHRFGMLNRRFV